MDKIKQYDICVIGGGAGGLSVASASAQLGVNVALCEGNLMGGDCLNYGCIPSKALLSIAKRYHDCSNSNKYGFNAQVLDVDMESIMAKVHEVIAQIAPHDSVERFNSLGVDVYQDYARFINDHTVQVGDNMICAKYFVIATGSRAKLPPIEGLNQVKYYTNENIFNLSETPKHLVIIGGGPIGCELAQAFAMLKVKVTLLEAFDILPRDDRELVAILEQELVNCGVNIYKQIDISQIKSNGDSINISFKKDGESISLDASHLLVSTGRSPNYEKLNLNLANIEYKPSGIIVDSRLRTSNRRVFAIGDVIGSYQFTHVAGYHAGIVIRNILFRIPAKINNQAIPWVTYTSLELAQVGLTQAQAQSKYLDDYCVHSFDFINNYRACCEHNSCGKIKLITRKSGKVLGVSILGLNAGELIYPWINAINNGDTLKKISSNIIPYPTLNDINKQVVGQYYKPLLFSSKVKKIVKFLKWFW